MSEENYSKTEIIRARCDEQLKARIARLATHRHCDEADILREASARHCDEEERRFNLPPLTPDAA